MLRFGFSCERGEEAYWTYASRPESKQKKTKMGVYWQPGEPHLRLLHISKGIYIMNLTSVTPESRGISSKAILDLIEKLDRHSATHGIIVMRRGDVLAEGHWQPFNGDIPHILNSFAKSVNVLAVGMAINEGKLKLSDRPSEFFKELLPENYDPRVLKITVKDLLRMTSSTVALSIDFNSAKGSWITHYFSYPMQYEPGTKFFYESGASYMLSAMVSRVYGVSVFELLKERLFSKMDIDAYWDQSPEGITCGGWGLYLKLKDMAKLAQLFLQRGMWKDEQLVPAEWIGQCTKKQVEIDDERKGFLTGYCYQFWEGRYGTFLAFGSFGQIAVCHPESETAIVIQAGCNDIELAYLESTIVGFFRNTIYRSLPEDTEAFKTLKNRLESLCCPFPKGNSNGSAAIQNTFQAHANPLNIRSLSFSRRSETYISMNVEREGGSELITAGYNDWADCGRNKRAAYAFKTPETLLLTVYSLDSCFNELWEISFTKKALTAVISKNASFNNSPAVRISATRCFV